MFLLQLLEDSMQLYSVDRHGREDMNDSSGTGHEEEVLAMQPLLQFVSKWLSLSFSHAALWVLLFVS